MGRPWWRDDYWKKMDWRQERRMRTTCPFCGSGRTYYNEKYRTWKCLECEKSFVVEDLRPTKDAIRARKPSKPKDEFVEHRERQRGPYKRRFHSRKRGSGFSLKKTFLVLLAVALIGATVSAFAGVQPLASYKDNLIENFKTVQAEWAAERERAEAERAAVEEAAERRNIEELEHNVVALVNVIRNERGSAPLIRDSELYTYSKQHSEDMASQKRLFHTSMYEPYAENAWGGEGSTSWTASDIVGSWMSSDFHRTWLLCPHLQHIAVGIAISDTGMYASWTFWRSETSYSDWWYANGTTPPDWWY